MKPSKHVSSIFDVWKWNSHDSRRNRTESDVGKLFYCWSSIQSPVYYLLIKWSAASFVSILPISISFLSGFRNIFRIRFYWHCCAPYLIYVYSDWYLCSRVLCICCFRHFWAIGKPIFHYTYYKTNKISIKTNV